MSQVSQILEFDSEKKTGPVPLLNSKTEADPETQPFLRIQAERLGKFWLNCWCGSYLKTTEGCQTQYFLLAPMC